jgi:hypothetical protein
MAGKWDDIHWVRTSADIPKSDLTNFTVQELCKKYPKVPKADIELERHARFPRRYPLAPEHRGEGLKYRRQIVVRAVTDLRDSIFSEHTTGEIRKMYPQFGESDIARGKAVRDAKSQLERTMRMLRNGTTDRKELARMNLTRINAMLDGISPVGDDLTALKAQVDEISANLG